METIRLQLGLIIFLLNLALVVVLAAALSVVGYDALDSIGKDMAEDTVLKMVNKTRCNFEDPLGKLAYLAKVATLNLRISTVGRYGHVGMKRQELPYWAAYHGAHIISTPVLADLTYMDVYGDRIHLRAAVPDHPNIYPLEMEIIKAGVNLSVDVGDNAPMTSEKYKLNRQHETIAVSSEVISPVEDHRGGSYWTNYVTAGVDSCWLLDKGEGTNFILLHKMIRDADNTILGAWKAEANLTDIINTVNQRVVGVTGSVYVAHINPLMNFGFGMYSFLAHPDTHSPGEGETYLTEATSDNLIKGFLKTIDPMDVEYTMPSYKEHKGEYSVGWVVLGGESCDSEYPPYIVVLAAPLKDFQEEADKAKQEFLVIALCIGLFGIGLAIGLWVMIGAAMGPLTAAIHKTTELRFDSIRETKSAIYEFNKISDALQHLVNRLAEYMKYLPDGVRAVAETEEIEFQSHIPPPQGDTVTIVFTDIQKSTFLWNTDAHAMSDSLVKHNNLFRRKMGDYQGYEVKTIGDAFMIAFPTYELAMTFCFDMQHSLLAEPWAEDLMKIEICAEEPTPSGLTWRGLRVRMAVSAGPVNAEANPLTHRTEYVGKTVCKSARIEGLACGGMILTTASNVDEAREANPTFLDECKTIKYSKQDLAEFGEVDLVAVFPKGLHQRADCAYLQTKEWKERQLKEQRAAISKSGSSSNMSAVKETVRTNKEFGTKLVPAMGTIVSVESIPEMGNSVFDHLTTISYVVEEAVERSKGVVIQISGVRFDVAWNAGKKCSGHPLQAVLFAANIHSELGKRQILRVGVSTGQILHGRVGSDSKRFKMVLGTVLNMSMGLCSLCSQLGAKVLISEVQGVPCAVHDPSLSASFRLVLVLRQANLEEFINIHEANATALARSNAWSYIATDDASSFTIAGLADAVRLAATGDFTALDALCEYAPFDSTIVAAQGLFKRWNGTVPRVRPYEDPNLLLGDLPKDQHKSAPAVKW